MFFLCIKRDKLTQKCNLITGNTHHNKYNEHTILYDYMHIIDINFAKSFSCQVCNQFHAQAAHIFGKRADPVELSLDGDCCSGDLCNHHVLVHASTTTTSSPDGKIVHCFVHILLIAHGDQKQVPTAYKFFSLNITKKSVMLIHLEQKKIYYDIDIKTNYSNLKDSSIGLFNVMAITIKLI